MLQRAFHSKVKLSDFSDVTLACEDNHCLKAHKPVIMNGTKELLAPVHNVVLTIDEHIKSTEAFKPIGERVFEYNLSEKATKAKLIKSLKENLFSLK